MEKFLNKKYKLDRVENFDEFFIEMGKDFQKIFFKDTMTCFSHNLYRNECYNEKDSKNIYDSCSINEKR